MGDGDCFLGTWARLEVGTSQGRIVTALLTPAAQGEQDNKVETPRWAGAVPASQKAVRCFLCEGVPSSC